jgi:hypothetical protein
MEDVEFLELETSGEQIFGHEFSVRDRCQQIGISLDNVRYRVGSDRFKWLALMAMLTLRKETEMFDDVSIDIFFERVLPRIPDIGHKNPLATILVFYITITDQLHFKFDPSKFAYIEKEVYASQELFFQNHGVKLQDLIRYIRLFEKHFSETQKSGL